LEADDPGLVPWITLTQFPGAPEETLRRCRDILDRKANPLEFESLMVVTQVLARLHYNSESLIALFGGEKMIAETPFFQELLAKVEAKGEARGEARALHKSILAILKTRFEAVPFEVALAVNNLQSGAALEELVGCAVTCPDLEAFRLRLNAVATAST
jgi:predicted transposase YdaD